MNSTRFLPVVSRLFLPLLIPCALLATDTHAQATPRYLAMTAENDIYVPRGQDRHYTNGIRLGVGLANDSEQSWYHRLGKLSVLKSGTDSQHYEFALGQNIYTPAFYITAAPLPDDRPYAGWLYGELSAISHRPGTEDAISVNIGIIGPAALGEPLQKIIHTLTGDHAPGGWQHQLNNEPALLLRYRRSWFVPLHQSGPVHADLVTRTGFNLGNVFTDAGIGAAVRVGNHLPEQDIPLRIQPGLSGGSHIKVREGRIDWMLFAELQGRIVARNIFLDGNTLNDSLSVAKRRYIVDTATGFILGFGQLKYPLSVSFTVVQRGREFDLQRGNNHFGSVQIAIQY